MSHFFLWHKSFSVLAHYLEDKHLRSQLKKKNKKRRGIFFLSLYVNIMLEVYLLCYTLMALAPLQHPYLNPFLLGQHIYWFTFLAVYLSSS